MIYFPNDSLDPAYNQAFEECAFELDAREDVLLIWRNRPAVVCGRYQNLFQEVHVPTAMARGVALVRRTTGGGCVYHDPGNVNYALITDYRDGMGYDAVLDRVVSVLRAVGVPAERSGSSALAVAGRKVSGSAQRISKGRLLHHGTMLFSADLTALRALANGHSPCYRSKAVVSAPAPVTNIGEHLPKDRDVCDFVQDLARAFAPERTERADFTGRAEALAEEKYRAWRWTFANSPKFTFERACAPWGSPMQIEYAAEKAVMRDVRISGERGPALSAALEGARLELGELRERVGSALSDQERTEQFIGCLL